MRLGIYCYATDTGLGVQTRALYDHLHPAKTMLVDLTQFNHMPLHEDWYDAAIKTNGFPSNADIDSFLSGLDTVLVCETPLNYYLFERAKQLGIKTVLQYNYEFLDYLSPRSYGQRPLPDILAAPTTWHIDHVRQAAKAPVQLVPVPVDLEQLPKRTITHARTFIHIAGRVAIHDRNGTLDFLRAVQIAAPHMPDARFIVYCQQPTPEVKAALHRAPDVTCIWNVDKPSDLYAEGDVLVIPRRYGGLCLPAQEALGCGIPVLMPDVPPNETLLPRPWLIPTVANLRRTFMTRCSIDIHSINTVWLAQKMLDLYRDDKVVVNMSHEAKTIAQRLSWSTLLPRYNQLLRKE